MEYLKPEELRVAINRLSAEGVPFMFLIDFKGEHGLVVELSQLAVKGISCSINGMEMGRKVNPCSAVNEIEIDPVPFAVYKKGFDKVLEHICNGDTYLLNLTYPTNLGRKLDMDAIYGRARSRYKFMLDDCFLFYSPEPFIQIEDGVICSFPMKGTISAKEENAHKKLLDSKKELYEHYTIVDLIRNDLSMVATDVTVESFRYVESITTEKGEILQTSTKIRGVLSDDWNAKLGDILLRLLPAGSVSGAPKERTVQIIEEVEIVKRGFYTGVMGVYENGRVDSCVIIRYLEKGDDGCFYYHSGGGVTALSNAEEEYRELLTKIYVPII